MVDRRLHAHKLRQRRRSSMSVPLAAALTATLSHGAMAQSNEGAVLESIIVTAQKRQENLQEVLAALAGQTTSVQALRYNREDARVAAFNGAQTVSQWQHAEPALLQLQAVFGNDNFQLPQPAVPEGCPASQP